MSPERRPCVHCGSTDTLQHRLWWCIRCDGRRVEVCKPDLIARARAAPASTAKVRLRTDRPRPPDRDVETETKQVSPISQTRTRRNCLTCPRGTIPQNCLCPGHACPRIRAWGNGACFSEKHPPPPRLHCVRAAGGCIRSIDKHRSFELRCHRPRPEPHVCVLPRWHPYSSSTLWAAGLNGGNLIAAATEAACSSAGCSTS